MSEVTAVLSAIERGDPHAAELLLPLVYAELRKLAAAKLAQEKPGQTLQPTSLVHEAYIRLVGGERVGSSPPDFANRRHFFAAAAEAMRRILIEQARRKKRLKRGGGRRRVDLRQIQGASDLAPDELLDVDAALAELAEIDPAKAELVNLRFYAGLSVADAAQALGVARATADRWWVFARAWLFDRIGPTDS